MSIETSAIAICPSRCRGGLPNADDPPIWPLPRDDLKAFLKDKLSPMEIPKLVEFRDELPKTLIGKLSRKAVLEEEAERVAGKSE